MSLHLITDDKFADYAINQFLSIDSSSVFLLVKTSENEKIKNIEHISEVKQIVVGSEEFICFFENISYYSTVIVHGLFYPWQGEILRMLPPQIKIAWIFWGGEIYGRPDLKLRFFSNKSKILYFGRKLIKTIKRQIQEKPYFIDKSIYQRTNYCLTDVHEDFEFVRDYTHSSMKELWYNYYSIEETLGELKHEKVNSNNILIGNSCTLENNHLDAFNVLKKFDLSDREIIVPLSYGDIWLKNILLKYGQSLFGSSYLPLTDFLNRNEYNRYLMSCSVVVMNHYRPQAMGNLITSLWLGSKVYMSNKSLLFSYFKRLGIYVFSIEDELKTSNKMALNNLDEYQIEHNRNILKDIYGKENVMFRVKEIVTELNRTE